MLADPARHHEAVRTPSGSAFLEMPVMLASFVGDISLYNVSNYATLNKHSGASSTDRDLVE
jgi:hypothetical protein